MKGEEAKARYAHAKLVDVGVMWPALQTLAAPCSSGRRARVGLLLPDAAAAACLRLPLSAAA